MMKSARAQPKQVYLVDQFGIWYIMWKERNEASCHFGLATLGPIGHARKAASNFALRKCPKNDHGRCDFNALSLTEDNGAGLIASLVDLSASPVRS